MLQFSVASPGGYAVDTSSGAGVGAAHVNEVLGAELTKRCSSLLALREACLGFSGIEQENIEQCWRLQLNHKADMQQHDLYKAALFQQSGCGPGHVLRTPNQVPGISTQLPSFHIVKAT